jgi:hypothetical protein
VTLPIQGDIPLSQLALAGGMVRRITERSGVSVEEVRRVYQSQCSAAPEDDHTHFVKWLRGWCATLDMVNR